jgi:hypothetical protein
MASNINPNNIDGTYPVAGQDNDSQGFRTNFTNIKNNFIYSKTELEDLQAKVVLKSALTGTNVDNNMAGTVFRSAEIKDLRETRVALGTTSGTVTLDHTAAHYYTVTTNGSISLSFVGLPSSGKLGRIRLEVNIGDVLDTLTLPANVTYGLQGIAGFDGVDTIQFYTTGTYIFEFISEDGGTNIHIQDLSRARDYFHSDQLTMQIRASAPLAIGEVGDIAGMIRLFGDYIYVCTGSYDGSTSIWKRALLQGYA